MRGNEAARRSCNCERAKSVAETRSIVSDQGSFRIAVLTVAFVAAVMAIPTVMAAMKAGGAW